MLDNVNHVRHFIYSTRRLCSLLSGWVSGLISKPYSIVVCSAFDGSFSRLTEERESSDLDFMDDFIYLSSSDDDLELEEVDDSRRSLPQWATSDRNSDANNGGWSRRDSFSRGENSSKASSSNSFNHSQVKPRNQHAKKSRHGKETAKKRKASSFPVEGKFLKKTYEEYCADPVEASVKVFRHLADITRKRTKDAENRARDAQKGKEEEKARALQAQRKLDSALTDLAKAQEKLSDLQKDKGKAETEWKSAADRVKDLELQLVAFETKSKDLELQLVASEAELKTAREEKGSGPISDLQSRVTELEEELRTTKAGKEAAELEVAETAEQALEMGVLGFSNALEQVAVILPSFIPDTEILKPEHGVERGKIVKVDHVTQKRILIYPPPSDL